VLAQNFNPALFGPQLTCSAGFWKVWWPTFPLFAASLLSPLVHFFFFFFFFFLTDPITAERIFVFGLGSEESESSEGTDKTLFDTLAENLSRIPEGPLASEVRWFPLCYDFFLSFLFCLGEEILVNFIFSRSVASGSPSSGYSRSLLRCIQTGEKHTPAPSPQCGSSSL